ncbi:MAG: peptidoglycan/xylan/chitin deacetylase (PgdA/CDA1 family) [Bermanella sp.]|jgi:peptidoglycan/xylan/chitin deacetylase (PgdA/CDA1 family)
MFRNVLRLSIGLTLIFVYFAVNAKQFNHGTILQYHHVNTTTPAVTSISPELFEQHLDLINEEGLLVIPLDVMIHSIKLGIPFKRKVVAITFDDNYRSIYDNAFPLLKKRRLPFTIFINPKSITSNNNSKLTLSWDHLSEMNRYGGTIANHTQNHDHLLRKLKNETLNNWKKRIKQEIESAQNQLEQELGASPKWLAYPYGEFDQKLKDLLIEMDYLGFSQQSGPINRTTDWQSIPRFPASGIYSNLKTLTTKINSLAFNIYSESPKSELRIEGSPMPAIEIVVDSHNVIHEQVACFFYGKRVYSESEIRGKSLIITAQFEGPIPFGRSRYNCTAPSQYGGYFWYSMPFISTNEQGQWQD